MLTISLLGAGTAEAVGGTTPRAALISPDGGVTIGGQQVGLENLDLSAASYSQIANGTRASYGLSPAGRVYSWGWGQYGQLGNNQNASSALPVAVDTTGVLAGKTITQVAGGYAHAVALDSDGHVYAWGQGTNGAVGDGSAADTPVPVAVDTSGVMNGKTIVQVAAANHYSLALDSDGKVYAWGLNINGTLGNGGTQMSPFPVAVDTSGVLDGKTLVKIAAGGLHVIAMDSDDKLYAWGNNAQGQLGNSRVGSISRVPIEVDASGALSGATVTQVRAGYTHNLALDSDGAVYAWGNNTYGQLGDGSTTRADVPIEVDTSAVTGGRPIRQIEAGQYHSVLLDSASGVAAWGNNAQGQLGNGSTEPRSTVPVVVDTSGVMAGRTLTHLASYGGATTARDSHGQVFAWGDNADGQLGNETTDPSLVPVQTTMHAVFFGAQEFRATGVISQIDAGTLTATTPAHPAGTVGVFVGLSGDAPSSTSLASFSYGTPTQVNGTLPPQTTIRPFEPIRFSVSATGDEAPSAQWELSSDGVTWAPLSGGSATTTPTQLIDGVARLGETVLSLDTTTTDTSGSSYYRATFSNALGQAYSSVARVTVETDPSLVYSSIGAAPPSLTADGTSTSTITVQLIDEFNNPKPGHRVAVTTTAGQISATADLGDGRYTATLRAPTTKGSATVGFRVDGQAAVATTTVAFTSGETSLPNSTISADPTTITADGSSTSTITVRAVDAHGNGVEGRSVVVTTTAGTITAATERGDGYYTAELRASRDLVTAAVGFTIDGQAAPATTAVGFVAGAPSMTASVIDAQPSVLPADGRSQARVVVVVYDDYGHRLSGRDVRVTTTLGTVAPDEESNGAYVWGFTASTTSGIATVGFTVDGQTAANSAQITLTPGAPSLSRSTITAEPPTVPATWEPGGLVVMTLRDQYGNPTPGIAVSNVVPIATHATVIAPVDQGDGRYTARIRSRSPGVAHVTFKLYGVLADDSTTVTFTPVAGQGDEDEDTGESIPVGEDEAVYLSEVSSAGDAGPSAPSSASAARRPVLPRTGVDADAPTEGFALLLTSGAALLVVRRWRDRGEDDPTGGF